jgi:hypothetical protein
MKTMKSKAPMTSILNPARAYAHSTQTDIRQSPAWQAAIAAREINKALAVAKVKSNVRRMK